MPAPPPPPQKPPLFKGQVVYVRCVTVMPARERYEDPTECILQPCDKGGKPTSEAWFYLPEKCAIPKTAIRSEVS